MQQPRAQYLITDESLKQPGSKQYYSDDFIREVLLHELVKQLRLSLKIQTRYEALQTRIQFIDIPKFEMFYDKVCTANFVIFDEYEKEIEALRMENKRLYVQNQMLRTINDAPKN